MEVDFDTYTSHKRRWPWQAGITLYEIIAILVVLSVVAVVAGALLLSEFKRARQDRQESWVGITKTQACMLTQAVIAYKHQFKKLPDNKEGLDALRKAGLFGKQTKDPWGRKYRYRRNKKGGFDVYSLGSDGKPGGKGFAADIYCRLDS